MEKLKKYKEWILIIALFAGWISTYLYDKKIRMDMVKQLEQLNQNWKEQFEFNGKVKMYIELDSK